MLDIKWIRDNAQTLDQALINRGGVAQAADILALDSQRRQHILAVQEALTKRNSLSKQIGQVMAAGEADKAGELKSQVGTLKEWLLSAEEEERRLEQALHDVLAGLPNIPLETVPIGKDSQDNIEIRKFGSPPEFAYSPREHYELGEALGLLDFTHAARMAGSRFSVLSGALARLERALGQFMLDLHIGEHGYREVSPPLLVRDDAVYGTAQLPKFSEDLFQTTDGRWLIPTAEVPLTNLVREEILESHVLPLRFTALTPCFRSEAGSAGRDTRSILRQHQFSKVEMVSITTENQAEAELERMTACAEEVLKRLELPFRTIVLCSGDMGFAARKTYDIEVWMPGQKTYREISSCSLCGDFQARRMNTRYRLEGEKGLSFVHTLNGSGTAVGRCLIAVMENYQQQDGSILVPEVLRPLMGGLERITADS